MSWNVGGWYFGVIRMMVGCGKGDVVRVLRVFNMGIGRKAASRE